MAVVEGRAYIFGMATMSVQVDEIAIAREVVTGMETPAGVRLSKIELSEDWTGAPAFRIYFAVTGPFPVPRSRSKKISLFTQRVIRQVLEIGTDRFPFVHLLETRTR